MKKFTYILLFVLTLASASCTEEIITPIDHDPIAIPPPPPKP